MLSVLIRGAIGFYPKTTHSVFHCVPRNLHVCFLQPACVHFQCLRSRLRGDRTNILAWCSYLSRSSDLNHYTRVVDALSMHKACASTFPQRAERSQRPCDSNLRNRDNLLTRKYYLRRSYFRGKSFSRLHIRWNKGYCAGKLVNDP